MTANSCANNRYCNECPENPSSPVRCRLCVMCAACVWCVQPGNWGSEWLMPIVDTITSICKLQCVSYPQVGLLRLTLKFTWGGFTSKSTLPKPLELDLPGFLWELDKVKRQPPLNSLRSPRSRDHRRNALTGETGETGVREEEQILVKAWDNWASRWGHF